MITVAAVVLALGAGVAIGLLLGGGDEAPVPPRLPAAEAPLAALPPGPVRVVSETVSLPEGFTSRHVHGGPTLNRVRTGRVVVADAEGRAEHGPGDLFVEPAGNPHTITVLRGATLDVVRLLPPGAEATTEVR